jgi:6-phosphogluconolactonase
VTRAASHSWLFIGTQRSGADTGFSRGLFDSDSGTISQLDRAAVADDPSFFVLSSDGRHLYTCNSGTPGGVSAYELAPQRGGMTLLNHHVSVGRGPSQLSLDRSERFVLAANYGGGYIEVVAIEPDGRLGARTAFIQHEGRSVHPERQTRPYAHCITASPSNRFALAADLGTDRVLVYRFDAAAGALTPHVPAHAPVTAGSGPRHLAWHPNGRWIYLIEELSNEVTTFDWDDDRGVMEVRQTVSTLPALFSGENTAAEVLVHPNGRFLYASNRGHDSVAVFAIDEREGTLALADRVDSGGRTPRYLAFDPTGRWLVVANCDSDGVAVFAIDPTRGALAHHASVDVARPYGLAFAPRDQPG